MIQHAYLKQFLLGSQDSNPLFQPKIQNIPFSSRIVIFGHNFNYGEAILTNFVTDLLLFVYNVIISQQVIEVPQFYPNSTDL